MSFLSPARPWRYRWCVLVVVSSVIALSPAGSSLASAPQLCVTMIGVDGQTGGKPAPVKVCLPADLIPVSAAPAGPTAPPGASAPGTQGAGTGYPTVGKFFFKVAHLVSFNCTGTVITALAGQSALVLVAAHCLYGDFDDVTYRTGDWKFVPEWHDNQAPFGTWQIMRGYYASLWPDNCHLGHCDFNPRYDFGLLVLKELKGQPVGSVTGSDGWAVNEPKTVAVTIAGLPGNSKEALIDHTVSHTVRPAGFDARKASTPGFGAGTSGGPWFFEYNSSRKLGDVLGETGGYQNGGKSDSPSYSPFLTRYFAAAVDVVSQQEKQTG